MMVMLANIFSEPILIQAILVVAIILNLFLLLKRQSLRPILAAVGFLSTFLILIITIPEFYGSFELSIRHFLEHTSLKILFILIAVQIHLFKGGHALSSKAYEVIEQELFNGSIERTSALQDTVEKIYELTEAGFFDRDLLSLSQKTATFLRNAISSVEKALNMFWNGIVKKGEVSLDMLRNIQTGLLSINLIFIITFLGLSLILIVLMWG